MEASEKEFNIIKEKLASTVDVLSFEVDIYYAFSLTFARLFIADTPNYKMNDGTIGATRSSWTYHTALALAQTSKMFNLHCKFESHGKRDAVIETADEEPEVLLFAEWEWDYEDIFGNGKELEKLKNSCRETRTAEAFLLVYCPSHKFADYITRIAEFWIKGFRRTKNPPSLFVHTIIFEQQKYVREFERLKTVVVNPTEVWVLNDIYFPNL
ncbi:MAG: hypothetical protein LUM44_17920 [Pyrinomonadaceae bacterium]|nr:hypothetical protein [Pyrinomonadaceae bacterium]